MNDVVQCSACGKRHPRSSFEIAFRFPDAIAALSEAESRGRVSVWSDIFALDFERYFIRAVLPIPVEGRTRPYQIGIWAEVSPEHIGKIIDLWESPRLGRLPPLAATLANAVPSFPSTIGMKVRLQFVAPPGRPKVFVIEIGSGLLQEQQAGITEHRAHEYSAYSS